MLESGSSGSVRGVLSNEHPYREPGPISEMALTFVPDRPIDYRVTQCVPLRIFSAPDRNLNAVEIGWPFRLGLEGCIVDRSQDIDWQSIRKDIAPFAVTWTYIPSRSVTL